MASQIAFGGYRAALVLAALLTGACGTGTEPVLAPTPMIGDPPAIAPQPAPEYWSLDQRLVSATDAETCGWGVNVGRTANWPLTVRRADSLIRLVYGDMMDELELNGILEGEAFTASVSVPGNQLCLGQFRDYIFESSVAGRFSADGQALIARETMTYRLASGETIVFTFDWAATKR